MPLLLADDLTGACDVGSACLRTGWKVRVVPVWRAGWLARARPSRGEAVVLDMETRRLPPRAAAVRAAGVGRALNRAGLVPVYFKMDSTLRGNWAVEGEALRRAMGLRTVWISPANPVQGRSTRGGRQFVRGVPVEMTPFARDPLHPVAEGSLVRIAERAVGYGTVGWVGAPVSGRVPRPRSSWVVADATTGRDLALAARLVGTRDLAMGSASWAPHIAGRGGGRRGSVPPGRLPGLAVIGSLNPLTARQVSRASRVPGIRVVRVAPWTLTPCVADRLVAAQGRGKWLVVALDKVGARGWIQGRNRVAGGDRLARRLGQFGAHLARGIRPGGLVMSGGLTAAAVLEAAGMGDLGLLAEPLPGLAVSRALLYGAPVTVVTKPGGFGGEGALAALLSGRGGVRWEEGSR